LQALEGNEEKVTEFINRYTTWNPDLHGKLAARMRDVVQYRYRMVKYKALQ